MAFHTQKNIRYYLMKLKIKHINDSGGALVEVLISMLLITSIIAPLLFFITRLLILPISNVYQKAYIQSLSKMQQLMIVDEISTFQEVDSLGQTVRLSTINTRGNIIIKTVSVTTKSNKTLSRLVYYDLKK